jgi:hypothetical protein
MVYQMTHYEIELRGFIQNRHKYDKFGGIQFLLNNQEVSQLLADINVWLPRYHSLVGETYTMDISDHVEAFKFELIKYLERADNV